MQKLKFAMKVFRMLELKIKEGTVHIKALKHTPEGAEEPEKFRINVMVPQIFIDFFFR